MAADWWAPNNTHEPDELLCLLCLLLGVCVCSYVCCVSCLACVCVGADRYVGPSALCRASSTFRYHAAQTHRTTLHNAAQAHTPAPHAKRQGVAVSRAWWGVRVRTQCSLRIVPPPAEVAELVVANLRR